MNFILKGHDNKYIVETTIQIFYPNQSHTPIDNLLDNQTILLSELTNNIAYAKLYTNKILISQKAQKLSNATQNSIIRELKYTIYTLLQDFTGLYSPWGMLTGIRPIKKIREAIEIDKISNPRKMLQDIYLMSEDKAKLLYEIYINQKPILNDKYLSDNRHANLYIGIPFCPSRCLYCSFTSNKIEEKKSNLYLDAIISELSQKKDQINNRIIKSIYIGGGTPTSLSAKQLIKLMDSIFENIDTSQILELTVEAGRPDTITKEKLQILKNYNTTRISINPQTMNNSTLAKIGRDHTAKEFVAAFNLARSMGFDNINVDLILGLMDETIQDVESTITQIANLNPSSITVHTLAIKRASKLKDDLTNITIKLDDIKSIDTSHNLINSYVKSLGMKPYYLYKQKNTIGNSHNIGYAKDDYVSLYNIHIMEDTQDIIALGAGAISKFINFDTNKITRIANPKDVDEYIRRQNNV